MAKSQPTPAPLIALGREAVEAVAAIQDMTAFRAAALHNPDHDSVIQSLPSFQAAKDAIFTLPLVAERYGFKDQAGDRLTLQFAYQLFPRTSPQRVADDVRRLWRRFIVELNVPVWVYRGVANLRNFALERNVPDLLWLHEGVTISGRSFVTLKNMGFNDFTLDALRDDWRAGMGASSYVIYVRYSVPKSPENLIRSDGTGITAAQQAITCMRLASHGDVMMGPMWFTRAGRFNVGDGMGALRGGWTVPTVGGSQYTVTRSLVREVRSLQPILRHLDEHGYEKGPGNLGLALRSFTSSYDRFPANRESQLVDTMTAAEAVLGSGTEITFKLAFRMAGILGRTDTERVQVFEDMKRFYDVRSKIVHGATLTGWRPEMLARADDARDLVRRLLVPFLHLAASLEPTKYTKKFFREDLDAEVHDEQARRLMLRALGIIRR